MLPNERLVPKKHPKSTRAPVAMEELTRTIEEGRVLTQDVARLISELQDSIDQLQLVRARVLRSRANLIPNP